MRCIMAVLRRGLDVGRGCRWAPGVQNSGRQPKPHSTRCTSLGVSNTTALTVLHPAVAFSYLPPHGNPALSVMYPSPIILLLPPPPPPPPVGAPLSPRWC